MVWIESHAALKDHPKTRKLARLLNVSLAAAIGHLHGLWWWAMEYAEDGDLHRYDAAEIAAGGLWEGDPAIFIDSLCEAGLMDGTTGSNNLAIHDWMDYAGRLVEIRRRKADSMKLKRAATLPARAVTVTARAVTNRTQPYPTQPDLTVGGSEEVSSLPPHPIPEHFLALKNLPGFNGRDHSKAYESIESACTAAGVSVTDVVANFAPYYQAQRFRHAWKEPVGSLAKTVHIEIGKILRPQGNQRPKDNFEKLKELERGASRGRPARSI